MIDRALIVAAAEKAGANLMPDNDQWRFRMEIRSESSSRLYTVAQNKNTDEWGCSCPAWKFRRTCKHIRVMLSVLTAPAERRKLQ